MKVKFGLRLKFSILFLVFMFFIALAVIGFFVRSNESLLREQRMDYAIAIANVVNMMMDETELQMYAQSKTEDEHYNELIEQMKEIQRRSNVYYLYVVIVKNEKEGIYFFDLKLVNGESVLNKHLGQYNDLKKNYPGFTEVMFSKNPSPMFDETKDEDEELDSVYVPIFNENDKVTAFVGIDFEEKEFTKQTRQYIEQAGIFLLGIMVSCFCILLFVVQFSILRPVYQLKKHARQISEGEFGTEITVRGHDELSEISFAFNRMSKSIAGHMEEMKRVTDAYYKYVPSKILTLLKKDSIEDIKLGNEMNTMLTVFSLQLSDFDRTIRKKSTKEMIDAINQILLACVPVVSNHEGMVERFQNAGFTALFDNGCKAAVSSAITVCQKLNHMVLLNQLEKNQVGIGIAYGEVTLGIVGQERRMAAITVSQYRDTACWLQNIAEQYQAHILITQTAANCIPDFFESYHTRTLGFLYNTYTGYKDRVYDVYDGDTREELESKNDTKELFEKGVELFCVRDFAGARQKFIAVLKRFRKDKAAKEYLYLCDKYGSQGDRKDIDIYFTKME